MNDQLTTLVTGTRGFLGRALAEHLRSCRAWSSVAEFSGPLSQASDTLGAHSEPFDVVFHLAASTPKGYGDVDSRRIIESNIEGLQIFLGALRGRCNGLVFVSTLDVYAPKAFEASITEHSPVGPESLYGASKWIGEEMCRAWSDLTGARLAVLRLTHTYGPGEGAYRKLIPTAIRCAIDREPLLLFGDGDAERDLLFVTDAARCIALVGHGLQDERSCSGIMNVASGSRTTVSEILSVISRLAPQPLRVERQPARVKERRIRFDVTRLRAATGFEPSVSLADGLALEMAHFTRTPLVI